METRKKSNTTSQEEVIVDGAHTGWRLDKYLTEHLPEISRNRLQHFIRDGNILLNGRKTKAGAPLKEGYRIQLLSVTAPAITPLQGEAIPLDIIYEDDHLLILNKPATMVVHPGIANTASTLANALIYHYSQLPSLGGDTKRPGLVHRIDKGTSGLLMIAKEEAILSALAAQFSAHTVERTYIALVWGDLKEDEQTITYSLRRSPRDRRLMEVCKEGEGKRAVTHLSVMQRFGLVTLVRCKLETGRTHQIRVHCKAIGHPLFGDPRYGGNRIVVGSAFCKYRSFIRNCFALLPYQALHAATLGFEHPIKKEQMLFTSPLPPSFAALVTRWERYTEALPEDCLPS